MIEEDYTSTSFCATTINDKKKKNAHKSKERSPKGIIKISNPIENSYPAKKQTPFNHNNHLVIQPENPTNQSTTNKSFQKDKD